MTVPELHRQIARDGLRVNLKSLYRLNREDHPVERLDLRVAGMICQVCHVPLSDLITFETTESWLRRFDATKQGRLDDLMARNNDGRLTPAEQVEFRALAREAEELALSNARMLAGQSEKPTSR
jgi:hypothetical protein